MRQRIDARGHEAPLRALAAVCAGGAAALSWCMACERAPSDQPAADAPRVREESPWRARGNSITIAVSDDAEPELAAAIRQARATAESARLRWEQAPPAERERWAVKWGARLALAAENQGSPVDSALSGPRLEYVWVRPVNWSAFRIEGILATAPLGELETSKELGDLVSFPIEELSDWVHFLDDGADASFEGGFTIKALQERYGEPDAAGRAPAPALTSSEP